MLAAIAALIFGAALIGIAARAGAIRPSVSDLEEIAAVPVSLRAGLVLTAGICEEFIYRSFAIEELTFLTSKRWLAAVITWFVFTVSHERPGELSPALFIPGIIGAALTVLYLWRRNLASCAIMHTIVDALFVVILPATVK